ncbi:MAG TPA: hypothetical protein VF719_00640 [Abditibacteriaceae bacterium]
MEHSNKQILKRTLITNVAFSLLYTPILLFLTGLFFSPGDGARPDAILSKAEWWGESGGIWVWAMWFLFSVAIVAFAVNGLTLFTAARTQSLAVRYAFYMSLVQIMICILCVGLYSLDTFLGAK